MDMSEANLSLPVEEVLPELSKKLSDHEAVILIAPPGAGKSTIVPLRLLEEKWMTGKKIILLEPRRLAAKSVASRMAQLCQQELGQLVGYRIRFESKESASTRLMVVTEGILIRMLQEDPELSDIGLVIFDEFHERSLQADVSLLLTREAKKIFGSTIRLLVMSATLQSDRISTYLQAPVVQSIGRQFKVHLKYLGGDFGESIYNRVVSAVHQAVSETTGDILVFLPGTGEILRIAEILESSSLAALVCPLYGDLPFQQQQAAIRPDPNGRRRVILATSVAETSLTIDGVSAVIDSGLSRVPRFDLQTGLTRLVTVPVSRDSAGQRAGRAGRMGPGVCYRLWEEKKTTQLLAARKPELLEADLAPVLIDLLNWGVSDLFNINWIDPPAAGHIKQALELLQMLEAVDNDFHLTQKGRVMAGMPLHPRLAHMLIEAGELPAWKALACDIAAILEERDLLSRGAGVDIGLRLKELKLFRAGERSSGDRHVMDRIIRLSSIWKKFIGLAGREHWPEDYEWHCGRLLAAAYPDRIGKQLETWGNRYRMPNGKVLQVDQADPIINSAWIVVANGDAGAGEGKIFLAASLEEHQLPGGSSEQIVLRWDDVSEQVVLEKELKKGVILISKKELRDFSGQDCSSILIEKIREQGLSWAGVNEHADQLIHRLNSLYLWNPDSGWPSFSEEELLKSMEDWLGPFLTSIRSRSALQRLDWWMIIQSRLDYGQLQKLDSLVPEKLLVPSGSQIALNYFSDGRPPELHVRLQEIFGWTTNPSVNQGKNTVLLHLLSPAYRPVQITTDLSSFWQRGYFEVRKEMRARYPKHSWPEDPLTAVAVRGVKRK